MVRVCFAKCFPPEELATAEQAASRPLTAGFQSHAPFRQIAFACQEFSGYRRLEVQMLLAVRVACARRTTLCRIARTGDGLSRCHGASVFWLPVTNRIRTQYLRTQCVRPTPRNESRQAGIDDGSPRR